MMTIKQLKIYIDELPDDMLVLRPGDDHSFEPVGVRAETVVQETEDYWGEDGGQDGTRVDVLVIE